LLIHLTQKSLVKISDSRGLLLTDSLLYMALIFFFCLRGYVGRDWYEYYKIYERIPSISNDKINPFVYIFLAKNDVEPLFCIYVAITKFFFPNYFLWLNFNSLVDVILLTTIIKYFNIVNRCLFFLLFCMFGGIAFEIDAIRNAKSIYIFLVSLRFLIKKNILSYLLLNLIGCLFHVSSLFYILFYFIANKKINHFVIVGLFAVGYVIFFTKINILNNVIAFFAGKNLGRISVLIDAYNIASKNITSYTGGIFGLIERFVTFLILFFNEKRLLNIFHHRVFVNALYLYLLIFLYCSSIAILAERLPLLFIFSYWFIYLEVYKLTKQKGVVLFLLISYGILKFISAWSNPMSLYENVLINHMSIDERLHYVKSYE
jgi:hypothetical protein